MSPENILPINGSVLPLQRAEDLLVTLPGVISARIVADVTGAVEEIHLLTTTAVPPKQTVRNVESALIAHLGMRVSHKKISVATSDDSQRPYRTPASPWELSLRGAAEQARQKEREPEVEAPAMTEPAAPEPKEQEPEAPQAAAPVAVAQPETPEAAAPQSEAPAQQNAPSAAPQQAVSERAIEEEYRPAAGTEKRRRIYFEDVEVRRSRSKGVACRVTLRKGDESFTGQSEGQETERIRVELAARAAMSAIMQAEGHERVLTLTGCKVIDAFERVFVFVGVTARQGRDSALITGSAEVRESAETASVLAVLDATNRWLDREG